MGVTWPTASWELATATTLTQDDLGIRHWINCSSASNLTLPTAVEGGWIFLFNYGTQTITVKNPGTTTIGTFATNEGGTIPCLPDASGNPGWPVDITELGDYLNLTSAAV